MQDINLVIEEFEKAENVKRFLFLVDRLNKEKKPEREYPLKMVKSLVRARVASPVPKEASVFAQMAALDELMYSQFKKSIS
jgi:hypothetical protein